MLDFYLPVEAHCFLVSFCVECCIAMVLISLKVCLLVFFFYILNFSSKIFIEGMCVVALAPTVMTISGSTFHLLLVMLSISG